LGWGPRGGKELKAGGGMVKVSESRVKKGTLVQRKNGSVTKNR